MKNSSKILIIICSIFVFNSCNKDGVNTISTPEAELLKQEINGSSENFYQLIEQKGFNVPYKPEILIANTEGLIYFNGNNTSGEIVIPLWEELSPDLKLMFEDWTDGSNYTGEEFFRENFNWFLPVHELGPFLQEVKQDNRSDYALEVEANKIAVAYWIEKGEMSRLEDFIALTQYIKDNKLPVQSDTSEVYFNSNYQELLSIPEAYGYFQFLFYQLALDSNPNLADFL